MNDAGMKADMTASPSERPVARQVNGLRLQKLKIGVNPMKSGPENYWATMMLAPL